MGGASPKANNPAKNSILFYFFNTYQFFFFNQIELFFSLHSFHSVMSNTFDSSALLESEIEYIKFCSILRLIVVRNGQAKELIENKQSHHIFDVDVRLISSTNLIDKAGHQRPILPTKEEQLRVRRTTKRLNEGCSGRPSGPL